MIVPLLVPTVADPAPAARHEVTLTFRGCDALAANRSALDRHVALELRDRPLAPTAVTIACEGERADLTAATSLRTTRATVVMTHVPEVALVRTLALAAVELVFAAQTAEPGPATPATAEVPAPRPEPRHWIRGGGGLEVTDPLLATARLTSSTAISSRLGLTLALSVARGRERFAAGRTRTDALDLFAGVETVPRFGRWLLPLGLGARVGWAWLTARPEAGVDAASVSGLRFGPAASLGAHILATPHLTVGLDAQLGWHVRGVRGLVDGATGTALEGGWFLAVGTLGARW